MRTTRNPAMWNTEKLATSFLASEVALIAKVAKKAEDNNRADISAVQRVVR